MHIEHIAIWCHDIDTMRAFYQTYFGAKSNAKYINTNKQFASYFLTFKTAGRLELMQKIGIPKNQNNISAQYIGLTHFAMSVGSQESVNQLTEQLRKDGYEIVGEPRWTGDGYYESVVLDPESNRIELTI